MASRATGISLATVEKGRRPRFDLSLPFRPPAGVEILAERSTFASFREEEIWHRRIIKWYV